MFGSAILEVAAGVIFIYILVCVICSAVREGIEGWLKTRAAYLEHGIRELLHDPDARGIVTDFFNHPLIFGLFSKPYTPSPSTKRLAIFARGRNLPSYIPAENFAVALMDIAARGPQTDALNSDPNGPVLSIDSIRTNIANLNNPAVQRVMLSTLDAAQGDLTKVRKSLETWFDSGMDRVSGWYKRSTQWIILAIALIVAVGMNVNTITIADYLFRNDATRAAVVAEAGNAADSRSEQNFEQVKEQLNSMNLPIGWSMGWGAPKPKPADQPWNEDLWNNLFAPITGWLLTAFAATMGAPFWFDMLNKVMVIRSTVKPHEKSPEEASEDRQKSPAAPKTVETTTGPSPTGGTPAAPPPRTGLASSRETAKAARMVAMRTSSVQRPIRIYQRLREELPDMSFSLTWLPTVLEAAGLKIALVDGWENRGRGDVGPTFGVICHHTAGPKNGNMPSLSTLINGRADLPGPLSQLGLGRDGTFYVIAAGRCNHAGSGIWKGLSNGNTNFIGIEAENTGLLNDTPWPAVQLDAYQRGAAAILLHIGRGAEFCAGHKEYALPLGRKSDPGFDMHAFRSAVAGILTGTTPMPPLIPPTEPPLPNGNPGRPTLRRGVNGELVKVIQKKLGLAIDGDFGPKTEAAVRAFQRVHDMVPDGIVGPKTWRALDAQG